MSSDKASPETTIKKKKLDIQKPAGILLTPGSSRRKTAWGRLRSKGENRGMTQSQISTYLETQMKRLYEEVRKESALTCDKVDKYLKYLSRTASQTLCQGEMNEKKVVLFSQATKPILIDIGSKQQITDSDVKKHTREITEKAKEQVGTPELEEEIVVELAENDKEQPEDSTPGEIQNSHSDPETTPKHDDYLDKEIVPVGFETGAPRISIGSFLELPLSEKDKGPVEDNWFAAHIRYLELAVNRSCFQKEDLEKIKALLQEMKPIRYKSYFNIFPDKEYDDTYMMIAYSRWRNRTLVPIAEKE